MIIVARYRFEKLRFQSQLCPQDGVFKFFQFEGRIRKASFSWRITRPCGRNKAARVFKFLWRSADEA